MNAHNLIAAQDGRDCVFNDPGVGGILQEPFDGIYELRGGDGTETRQLLPPNHIGQVITILVREKGASDVVVSSRNSANDGNQACTADGDWKTTFDNLGESITFVGVTVGGVPMWRKMAGDGGVTTNV